MTTEERAPWTTPILDQLTVDLDSVAAGAKAGNDGKGAKTKS